MAASPENIGHAKSDHHSPPYHLQSVEKLHAITSTRKPTIYGHRTHHATTRGGGSMADPTASSNTSIHLTKTPIESVESKRRRK
jgi:hypothetical protein